MSYALNNTKVYTCTELSIIAGGLMLSGEGVPEEVPYLLRALRGKQDAAKQGDLGGESVRDLHLPLGTQRLPT